jgi:hypothetical protein
MLSDVFDLQNLGFFSCDTSEAFGDTQMCRDTQFEKHWSRSTCNYFQTFSLTAAQKTEEIGREAEKADRLLYQILPKTVAKKLLKGKQVSSIHFKRTISRMINIVLNDFIICEIRSVLEMLSTKSN